MVAILNGLNSPLFRDFLFKVQGLQGDFLVKRIHQIWDPVWGDKNQELDATLQ